MCVCVCVCVCVHTHVCTHYSFVSPKLKVSARPSLLSSGAFDCSVLIWSSSVVKDQSKLSAYPVVSPLYCTPPFSPLEDDHNLYSVKNIYM